ncbi:MAG TPA: peptidoglycan binding domain-containing protein, partial [Ramlibacter sp.]|nr:peptidoglycan binding domain-containing protein [Ramlibacter sp.]
MTSPLSRRAPIVAQVLATLVGGLLLFIGLTILWVIGYQLVYAGRIFPGVSVAGVDLSGMAPAQAALRLSEKLSYPISGKVVFRDADKAWIASPVQLGMVFDPSASARTAYQLGRSGGLFGALDGQLRARALGYDVAPVIIFDQRVAYQYLQGLAQQLDRPLVEASLKIDGANISAVAGQAGNAVNVDGTMSNLVTRLQTFQDGEVQVAVEARQPLLMDVSAQAEAARQIVSQPLQLVMPGGQTGDPGPWAFQPEVVAHLIGLQKAQDGTVALTLDANTVQQMLSTIENQVDRQAANARFHFDDASGQLIALSSSQTGRKLDMGGSVKAITEALLRGEHSVPLVVDETQPAVPDTATAQQLGISGLLPNGVQTSY